MKPTSPSLLPFPRALKSFVGYLEGTDKSAHTIKNYRLDLLSFQQFIESERSGRGRPVVSLDQIEPKDVDRFQEHLEKQGLKTNTRRRQVLTVRRFLLFLVNRNKLPEELGRKVPTPHKIERVPAIAQQEELIATIQALPQELLIDERNRVMLWTLAETGAQVSEVAGVRYDQWVGQGASHHLEIPGKAARSVPVSLELAEAVRTLRKRSGTSEWVFLGFNKFGALGGAISSRGVELLVRHYGPSLGYPALTPRMFRHSAVVGWFKAGVPREEIQRRLGLKTPYAFRSYEPLFKGISLDSEARSSEA